MDGWMVSTMAVLQPEAWITLAVLAIVLSMLIFTRRPPDIILVGGLTLLMVLPVPPETGFTDWANWRLGVISVSDALAGFSNEGMITVAALFIVVTGLQDTGALSVIGGPLLGRPKSARAAVLRMVSPVAFASAFLNNTPIVAMMLPLVNDWAKKIRVPVSKLLIPLSYATILGGTCTLIGTSTNLVVNGMLIDSQLHPGLGIFDQAWVGLPMAIVGLIYLVVLGPKLLPDRTPPIDDLADPREYCVEMMVEPRSPLVGKTIEEAGLRNLPGAYLAEIERNGRTIPAVAPTEVLEANDRLVFVGVVDSVVDLQRTRGLVPATNQVAKLDAPKANRELIEAVVSDTCPVVGRTIREGRFRTRYGAVVIAVARNGQRLPGKIGDIKLRVGDTLLLQASPNFVDQQRNSRDFYLVSRIENSRPLRREYAPLALLVLITMVVTVGAGFISMLKGALVAGLAMIVLRCCTASAARRSIDWPLLLVIASAIGIGRALEVSGAASTIAGAMISLAGNSPYAVLIVLYLMTMAATAFMTNNAAAVLLFPIAANAAANLGVNVMPFVIAIMMAASAEFSTPIGYQTNLMVYGPGGYRFTDYVKVGLPLNMLTAATALILIPLVWKF